MFSNINVINSFKAVFLLAVLLCLSTSEFTYFYTGISLLGNNAFVVLPFLIFFFMFSYSLFIFLKGSNLLIFFTIISVFVYSLSCIVRLVIYGQEFNPVNDRFIFSFLIAYGSFIFLNKTIGVDSLQRIVLFSLLIFAILQLGSYTFYTNVGLLKTEGYRTIITDQAARSRDGVFGSSLVAYHCVLGLLFIQSILIRQRKYISFVSETRNSGTNLKQIILVLCTVPFIFTILYSQTRLAVIFLAINFLMLVFSQYRRRFINIVMLIFFIIIFSFILLNLENLNISFSRFDASILEGPRVSKTILSLSIIFDTPMGFFFGYPSEYIEQFRTSEGIQVSDNSYLLLFMKYGFLLFIFWIISFYFLLIRLNGTKGLALVISLWAIISLGVTNSILWDSYIFSLTFLLMAYQATNRELKSNV